MKRRCLDRDDSSISALNDAKAVALFENTRGDIYGATTDHDLPLHRDTEQIEDSSSDRK
jgi:hypothetical protein